MADLKISFESAKQDISNSWEFPLRQDARITRDWIYTVDPETMDYAKEIFSVMPGDFSLYTTIVRIMKSNSFEELLNIS